MTPLVATIVALATLSVLFVAGAAGVVLVLSRLVRDVLATTRQEAAEHRLQIERLLQRIQAPLAAVAEHGAREALVTPMPDWMPDRDAEGDEMMPLDEDLALTYQGG